MLTIAYLYFIFTFLYNYGTIDNSAIISSTLINLTINYVNFNGGSVPLPTAVKLKSAVM